ncbi:MAG: efflux RND transporter permease subunit [Acidobacteria bacterium]|nr:efflux RND transporter permease subunit [Acidobacteriota bacterium]
MNIPSLFIHRPVTTVLFMLGILLFGVMAYITLPVSDLPNVDYPTIQVSASLPGASPETMAASVALPLERQFSTIAGIDNMTSTSGIGATQITLQFSLERDLDAAAQDVQSAIAQAQRRLPRDMPNPPSFRKVNPADQPILYIAMTSDTLPLSVLNEYAATTMGERISMINGVAQVMVYGSQKYAVRIQLDPKRLTSRNIGIDEVVRAVRDSNVELPSGVLYGPHRAYTVQSEGQLLDAEAYRNIIVVYRDGSPVYLRDLGRITDSVENDKTAAWYVNRAGSKRAVVLAIQRQPGTNTVQVVENILDLIPMFKEQLPASVDLNILYDRSRSIRESVNDVKFTLMLTLCLVILVIFLFLRNVSATLIPSLALPFSIVGTFAVMYLFGFSMNNLSLMALTLSVGFVVDDAIVMLENIVRHLEMGKKPLQAALDGSREIGFTIVSMTISLAAVFIPVLFMGGILGRLFHEFAVTIAAAILISGVVSLTLTPMMASRFLRAKGEVRHGALYRSSEKVFDFMLKGYDVTLRFSLRHKLGTLLLSFVILLVTWWVYQQVPKGFIPSEDTGQIRGFTEAIEGISFDSMVQHQQAAADIIRRDPDVAGMMSNCGARGGARGGNSGMIFMRLKSRDERESTADEVINRLRPQLASVTGMQVYLQNPPTITIGGQFSRALYQFTLQSTDIAELNHYAPLLEARLSELPGLTDVNSDLLIKNPEVRVEILRDKATSLGVSAYQVEDALFTAFGTRQISTMYAPNNQYYVIMELLPDLQREPGDLSNLYIKSGNDRLIPLDTLARIRPDIGPLSVNHVGQLPAATISFNLEPGVSLADALQQVEAEARELLPATVTTSFQGTAQAFQSSLKGMGLLLVMAIVVIYLVLGVLYESFIHPVTILSGLPSAGLGALITLWIFGVDLNIFSFVGIIMLVGIVKKNAIMMIDFALEAERRSDVPPADAIYRACLIRFRPIMMTTMAAFFGTMPIAIGFGAGGESRQPLGLAVVGGLVVSQIITLYLTPVVYIYLDRLQRRFGRKKAAPAVQPQPEQA